MPAIGAVLPVLVAWDCGLHNRAHRVCVRCAARFSVDARRGLLRAAELVLHWRVLRARWDVHDDRRGGLSARLGL